MWRTVVFGIFPSKANILVVSASFVKSIGALSIQFRSSRKVAVAPWLCNTVKKPRVINAFLSFRNARF